MNILDCESIESAEISLCELLNVSLSDLRRYVSELAGMKFEINTDSDTDRRFPMLRHVTGCDVHDRESGSTCFFHATRVATPETFRTGIRSLPEQIDSTWSFLYSLVANCLNEIEWQRFRCEVEKDDYGRMPMVNQAWMSQKGPFAFLFAETPLTPKDIGNHDYLAISELADDIIRCFDRNYTVHLRDLHQAATKPFLIKFKVKSIRVIHVGRALDYLVHRKARWSMTCLDPCFSGEGNSIPPTQILQVIPVNEFILPTKRAHTYSI